MPLTQSSENQIIPKNKRGFADYYSLDYQNACFAIWYKAGKPQNYSHILKILPKDEQGRSPSKALLNDYWLPDWRQRADVLDAESNNILDRNLIQARVEMLENQAKIGVTLQKLGLDYFSEHNMDDPAVALRAIVQGVEMERNSRGLSVALQRISNMSDSQLQSEISKQLERYKQSKGEIVEGEVVNNDTVFDDDEEEIDDAESA